MSLIGRRWHEDDPLALAIHDALVMRSKSLGDTLQTARAAKIAAEVARQHDRGAVLRADVLERALTMACGSADVRESCIRQAQAEQDRARIDAGRQ